MSVTGIILLCVAVAIVLGVVVALLLPQKDGLLDSERAPTDTDTEGAPDE